MTILAYLIIINCSCEYDWYVYPGANFL